MCSFGRVFGKNFRRFLIAFLAVVLLILLGCTDASSGDNAKNPNIKFNGIEVYDLPAIEWACQPFLNGNPHGEDGHPLKEKTRELCEKIRGGELGKGIETEVNAAELSNSSINDNTIALLEREGDGSEQALSDKGHYVPSNAPTSSATDYTFSLFQKGDGHETDPDGIPDRYLKMQGGKRDLAKAAMENTVQWRKEEDIDTILARPHPKFDVSKAVFPHYLCGRDDTGHVILLQRPGLMNVKLAHKNGLTGEELLLHYIYVMEYLWRILDPSPDGTMTSIIDLTELNISILRKREQLRIGSLFLSTMDAHFPQRSHRTFLINAPKWFGALYKLASPLLRESTKEKIQILSKGKEQDRILKDLLRDCPIPEGDKLENVPPGIMEEELRDFCLARLEEAGTSMQTVEAL